MTEEEKGNEKKKEGFTWVDDINAPYDCQDSMHIGNGEGSYSGAVDEQDNEEEKNDWDNVVDLSRQACQHAHQVADSWLDYAGVAVSDLVDDELNERYQTPFVEQVRFESYVSPSIRREEEKKIDPEFSEHITGLVSTNDHLYQAIIQSEESTKKEFKKAQEEANIKFIVGILIGALISMMIALFIR